MLDIVDMFTKSPLNGEKNNDRYYKHMDFFLYCLIAKLTNFSRTEDIIKPKIFLQMVDPWFCCPSVPYS